MSSSPVPRSLADQFRSWPEDRLRHLLQSRPDLAQPAPHDSAQLASRASTRASVGRALDRLTLPELTTLEAVAGCAQPASLAQVQRLVFADPANVEACVEQLVGLALLWGTPDELRVPTTVSEVLVGTNPLLGWGISALLASYGPARVSQLMANLGLRPTGDRASDVHAVATHLTEPDQVLTLVGGVDDRARAILDHLERASAEGTVAAADRSLTLSATDPTEQLLARALLVARTADRVTVPREVAIALRGGHTTRDAVDRPPALATTRRDPVLVSRTAAQAASAFVRHTELLLELWGTNPPPALRQGGLGVRELKAVTVLLHVDERAAALIIETAAAAGLLAVGSTDELEAAWLPTDGFDLWNSMGTSQRWVALATAWLDNPRLTGKVGGRIANKPVNALSTDLERPWLPLTRRTAMQLVTGLTDADVLAATTGVPSLVELGAWQRPRQPKSRTEAILWSLEEAGTLGVMALGGLAAHGRAVLADDPAAAAEALEPLLPTPVDHVLVQADLTAVAPGPLEQRLGRDLATVADVESRGGATTYRFTESSVRRAFDSGWSVAEVHAFLAASSRTPIPQSLEYLVNDVARKFGTVRIGMAECFLRSDDEAELTALVHDQGAASLRLRRIAPTVVVSDVPLGVLLPRLRELGIAPVVEAADGTVRVARRDEYRSRSPRQPIPPARATTRTAARTAAVVAAVRAGDRATASRPVSSQATSPADVMALLREAVESGASVLIGYVGNDGAVAERIVAPRRVEGGQLSAHDERSDETRSFAIHRVTRASTI